MRWTVECPESQERYEVELIGESDQGFSFRVNNELLWIRKPWDLQSEKWNERDWRASLGEQVYQLKHLSALSEGQTQKGQIQSEMPGRVLKILCKEGDVVEAQQSLLILEAMKMENEIRSEMKARVKKIHVSESESIETSQKLIDLEAFEDS